MFNVEKIKLYIITDKEGKRRTYGKFAVIKRIIQPGDRLTIVAKEGVIYDGIPIK